MTSVLSILSKVIFSRWSGAAFLSLFLGVSMWGAVRLGASAAALSNEKRHSEALQTANAGLERDIATCHANVANLNASLQVQKSAVEALKTETASRLSRSEQALQAARKDGEASDRRVTELLNRRPEGDDLCAAAESLIRESVR